MGRFLSPDWASGAVAVPYAAYADPQSLNLYNYMRDNPLGGIDADGHSTGGGCSKTPQVCKKILDDITSKHMGAGDAIRSAPQQNVNNDAVGKTTVGNLSKVLTNEIGSLGTPKGGDPKQLQNGANAIANALINNANRKRPNEVAPDTGTASSPLSQIMQDAYTNRANGGADPVGGRTFYGTSHIPPSRLHSRPIGRGRQSVYESFGPFNDSRSRQTTWIYIYNDPGH
jgi:hypothetical protein